MARFIKGYNFIHSIFKYKILSKLIIKKADKTTSSTNRYCFFRSLNINSYNENMSHTNSILITIIIVMYLVTPCHSTVLHGVQHH
jgi:hypothetical protein